MEEFTKLISTVGFPIAVTAFLLWRLDTTMRELRDAVRDLIGQLEHLRKGD